MFSPLIYEIIYVPATSFTIAVCVSIWLLMMQKNLTYEHVGMSYHKIVHEHQIWRGVAASLSHLNLLHLFFNMSSLWSCRYIEMKLGSIFYLKYSLLLMVASVAIIIATYHILIYRYNKEEYMNVLVVGYSCVAFGWMTILAQFETDHTLFGWNIPFDLAPFGALIFTSLLISNASFVGHLSGIIIGYVISFLEHAHIEWYSNWLAACLLTWTIIAFLVSLNLTTNIEIPFIQLEDEVRPRYIIQDGILMRQPESV